MRGQTGSGQHIRQFVPHEPVLEVITPRVFDSLFLKKLLSFLARGSRRMNVDLHGVTSPLYVRRVYIHPLSSVLCYSHEAGTRLIRVWDSHEGETRWDGIGTPIDHDRLMTHLRHDSDGDRTSIRHLRLRHLPKLRSKRVQATPRSVPRRHRRHRPMSIPLRRPIPPPATRHPA
ncbi:hypothetical protein NITHO_1420005 [Nitrolancea hollandica Lb]|uniref:Uncharacterized protein n=1 Tax=Nitrolancea hollandica Lb TaxID=1129897 RepID=I4EDA3_9BACT|nr:hypothetical protein NITHO_1420005 [Nitrolancea hollandica Lb]